MESETGQIKIFIVDDHQILIDGLRSLLEDVPDFSIVGSTTEPGVVLEILKQQAVDVLLTDVMMPVLNGKQLAQKVRLHFPNIKILALSMSGQGDVVDAMINDADINGYVLKNIGKTELTKAITKIAGGSFYFSDEVLIELEKQANNKKESEAAHLTIREKEIIGLIEKELNNKEIAERRCSWAGFFFLGQ